MRPGRKHDTTALRRHDILPLLAAWTDEHLRVLGDLGYEGEQSNDHRRVQETRQERGLHRPSSSSSTGPTTPSARSANAPTHLLKTTFKALRNVSLRPWTNGRITAAALVILHIEHGRTT